MGDEEIQYEAMKDMAAYQAALDRVPASTPAEIAEYIRELADDKIFVFKDGRLREGHLPEENKYHFWSINSPNFVFSKFDDKDIRRIDNMQLLIETSLSTFTVNNEFFARKREKVYANKNIDENKKRRLIELINFMEIEAQRKVDRIINNINQELQTYAKARRAGVGSPGAERQALITHAVMSDRPSHPQPKSFMEKMFGRRSK